MVDRTPHTGADAVCQTLYDLGVTHIFGMDSPEPLYAALDPSRVGILTIHDERNGAIMADAFARVSGRAGVCTATRGPGVTNLLTGLAEAWNSSTPVVALVSDTESGSLDRHAIQELDHVAITSQLTKWAMRLDRPERVAEATARAFQHAVGGRPGPVLLSFADSALEGSTAHAYPVKQAASYPGRRSGGDPADVAVAAEMLSHARRPVIVCGGGIHISGAYDALKAVASALQCPVATTPLGKGGFDETHPLAAGVVGGYTGGQSGRGRIANDYVKQADVVLLVGTKTDANATANWTVPDRRAAIIHVDIDPAEIGRNYPSHGIVGDAALVMAQLLRALSDPGRPDHDASTARVSSAGSLREALAAWDAAEHHGRSAAQPIRSERVVAELAAVLSDDSILVTDASYSSAWAMDRVRLREPGRRFVAPRGFAGIGWGLPAALGAKLAAPEKAVYCLTGDGGFGYVAMELETAARYAIPVVVIVLNNSILGFQKHFEQAKFGRTFETSFLQTDYGALARVLHCEGIHVDHPDELHAALTQAVASGRPTVIDVVCDESVKPPLAMFDLADAEAIPTH